MEWHERMISNELDRYIERGWDRVNTSLYLDLGSKYVFTMRLAKKGKIIEIEILKQYADKCIDLRKDKIIYKDLVADKNKVFKNIIKSINKALNKAFKMGV